MSDIEKATAEAADIKEVTVTLDAGHVSVIFAALAEAPYKVAQPVMLHIQDAIKKAIEGAQSRIIPINRPLPPSLK